MASELFSIAIGGGTLESLYKDLISMEVRLDDREPSSFRLIIGVPREADGTWRYLDDESLRVWSTVEIEAGFGGGETEPLMTGYMTATRAYMDQDETRCTLELSGLDASVLMDREEMLKDWPGKKDSDIAQEILSGYGFSVSAEDTPVVHEEDLSTILQRDTDWQFLRRLALRNGYVCCIEGNDAYFGPALIDTEPQPILAAHFGDQTNLKAFQVRVDALAPAQVTMTQVDRLSRKILTETSTGDEEDPLGALRPGDLLPAGGSAAKMYISRNLATGNAEMEQLCKGLAREGTWFASAEGEIDAAAYGQVLRPQRLVTIKGVGETNSGIYYVNRVRHLFNRGGYRQIFQARRDALMPTGDEDFSGGGSLLGGLL